MGRKSNAIDEESVCKEYIEQTIGIESLATKHHVGKAKIKEILAKNGIDVKKRGAQTVHKDLAVKDWRIKKYKPREGYHFVATDRKTGFSTPDYENRAGVLTTHIEKEYGVATPTLYDRRVYYMKTGNYWWEKWFEITEVENKPVKKCPYCNWTTVDVENRSGMFETHLKKEHGISKLEYLEEYPEDRKYFELVSETKNRQMETDEDKYVVCMVCGAKLSRIDSRHLRTHGMTKKLYLDKYGNVPTLCNSYMRNLQYCAEKMNLSLDGNNDKFTSKPEKEIRSYVTNLGFGCSKNRRILNGKELDLYIKDKHIAIEYHGNKWHTEWFGGKTMNYHVSKLNQCRANGVQLLQIFEDEYICKREIVMSKLACILGADLSLKRIRGHKCKISVVDACLADEFLDRNHIQGSVKATVYLGAFYDNVLVGVMLFTKYGDGVWSLTRFATDISLKCYGVGGKLFKFFVENYNAVEVRTFADRRWTINEDSNLYTKLGFKFYGYTTPSYWYYNPKVDRYKRFHKFGFRKQILHRKYGLPMTMTESEMTRSLGYDRIWDCGLLKYVWRKE